MIPEASVVEIDKPRDLKNDFLNQSQIRYKNNDYSRFWDLSKGYINKWFLLTTKMFNQLQAPYLSWPRHCGQNFLQSYFKNT